MDSTYEVSTILDLPILCKKVVNDLNESSVILYNGCGLHRLPAYKAYGKIWTSDPPGSGSQGTREIVFPDANLGHVLSHFNFSMCYEEEFGSWDPTLRICDFFNFDEPNKLSGKLLEHDVDMLLKWDKQIHERAQNISRSICDNWNWVPRQFVQDLTCVYPEPGNHHHLKIAECLCKNSKNYNSREWTFFFKKDKCVVNEATFLNDFIQFKNLNKLAVCYEAMEGPVFLKQNAYLCVKTCALNLVALSTGLNISLGSLDIFLYDAITDIIFQYTNFIL